MTNEPRYVDAGDEFEDDDWTPGAGRKRPKWMIPQSNIERRMLRAIHPHKKFYNENDKKARERAILIAKGALNMDGGVVSEYPEQWIEHCCKYIERMRKEEKRIYSLKGLITIIENKERRDRFILEYEPQPMFKGVEPLIGKANKED